MLNFPSSSFIPTILYSLIVPTFCVPSVLYNFNAHIVSAFGADVKAELTVSEETFPALVLIG